MHRAYRFLETYKLIIQNLICFISIYYRICIPKTKYNGLCIILTLIILSILWQLFDEVV